MKTDWLREAIRAGKNISGNIREVSPTETPLTAALKRSRANRENIK